MFGKILLEIATARILLDSPGLAREPEELFGRLAESDDVFATVAFALLSEGDESPKETFGRILDKRKRKKISSLKKWAETVGHFSRGAMMSVQEWASEKEVREVEEAFRKAYENDFADVEVEKVKIEDAPKVQRAWARHNDDNDVMKEA